MITLHKRILRFKNPPKVLAICLSRNIPANIGPRKSDKLVTPLQQIKIEDERNIEMFCQLKSVVAFFANTRDYGHVVCYNIISDDAVMEIDDDEVKIELLDQVKPIIGCNGYILFFSRTNSFPISSHSSNVRQGLSLRLIITLVVKLCLLRAQTSRRGGPSRY